MSIDQNQEKFQKYCNSSRYKQQQLIASQNSNDDCAHMGQKQI
ncbi:12483_t:CDS:2 [Gigaspora margarita]|uniref:12483_t:CDS:1 n=1 Tax=Gigaspora margarita TaxID=4874 RepID=A0ABM8VVQ6_GIGMA|nr:12483_t:CDS:2 [Gigaspora margarita]